MASDSGYRDLLIESERLLSELQYATPDDRLSIYERYKAFWSCHPSPAIDSLCTLLKGLEPYLVFNGVRTKKHLVAVVHGIRDQGEWMESVKSVLADPANGLFVELIDLGEDFSAWNFMRGATTKVLKEFARKLRLATRDFSPDVITIIAHSFGTWLFVQSADEHPDLQVDLAIFCGSVVPRRHRFEKMAARPIIVVNECGARDLWPILAQGFAFWSAFGKYGAGGVFGFRVAGVVDRFHDFGHSNYLDAAFVSEFWKPLVLLADRPALIRGAIQDTVYQKSRRVTPWGVSQLARGWSWVVTFSAIFILLVVAFVLCPFAWRRGILGGISAWLGVVFAFIAVLIDDMRRWFSATDTSSFAMRATVIVLCFSIPFALMWWALDRFFSSAVGITGFFL